MRGIAGAITSAAVGGLVLCASLSAAQGAPDMLEPGGRLASLAPGAIHGAVQDEMGEPVAGAVVSAVGATVAFAVADHGGKFVMRSLLPGPYLLQARLSGFVTSRGQIVEVRPSGHVSSSISLHHSSAASTSTSSYPVLAAGLGSAPTAAQDPATTRPTGAEPADGGSDDDQGETAWRLRHARRSILKDITIPGALFAGNSLGPGAGVFGSAGLLDRAIGSPARLATEFFAAMPVSGQFNLLTTGSFDTPQQLFTTDNFSRSIAYLSVGAAVGSSVDWTIRAALSQGDIGSWIVAGSYAVRAPARNQYEIGMSYSAQRFDSANPATLLGAAAVGRDAGEVYGFDTLALAPGLSFTYGARYARYDYLAEPGLFSPRLAVTFAPAGKRFRISSLVSRRALAPGAEEFVPPTESSIWLPPQRTFSSLYFGRPLQPERTDHLELQVEREVAPGSTVLFRAFRQNVSDQLVTMFGFGTSEHPAAEQGHYFVGNNGSVEAIGWSTGVRTAIANRVHGSVEYTQTQARWNPTGDLTYLVLVAPSATRLEAERIHDVSTSIETDVPETSTRVIVLFRVSNAFAQRATLSDHPAFDSRFDVQVRQSLPFMNFCGARWEMLLAVRSFFREAVADQSIYDELLVIRPPKRVVGGLTLRF